MDWLQITIKTTSEGTEAVAAMLMEVGINEIQIEDVNDLQNFLENNTDKWDYVDEELMQKTPDGKAMVTFYVPDNERAVETISAVKDGVKRLLSISDMNLGDLKLKIDDVSDENWLNEWKKYYKPFQIGKNIIIRPEWEPYDNPGEKVVLTINPAHVFGTGLHQTTQLCIKQLENLVKLGSKVLDLGCGSGILSIAALLLGADEALAIDLDPEAVSIAYENAERNGIFRDRYTVRSGNIITDDVLKSDIEADKYDIVVANIVADVIVHAAPFVAEKIKPGGVFISSGIIRSRLEEVYSAFDLVDLAVIRTDFYSDTDEWVCVVANRVEG